tara:strand:+ start:639 stop:2519 length:1881 start_codon:yes stop_codon:yes gene_type:complete
MPKIPVYQQNVEMAAGSLGPRATSAFEAPGRALAGLGKQVGDTAFKFGMIERDREDKRVKREEYATAFTTANNMILADTSTNFQDAQDNFEENVRKKIMQDIDNKGYSKRRTQEVKGFVDRLLLEKQFEAKQKAVARGKIKSAAASDSAVDVGLQELKGLSHNSILFQPKVDALKALVDENALVGLPTRYNPGNLQASISGIEQNSKRTGVQNNIASATDDKQIEAALNSPEFKELSAPEQNTLRSLAKVRSGEIESSLIASYVNTVPIENVGETDFDTVEDVRQKIEDGRKGKFDDANLTERWKKLDQEVKNKIEAGWQARLNIAQTQVDHKRRAKDAIEANANEELFTDLKSKIKDDVPDPEIIKKINEADFQGEGGERFRDQLLNLAARRARGEIISDSAPIIYRDIDQGIKTQKITSVTQKFTLASEVGQEGFANSVSFTKGKSILERQGLTISDQNADEFEQDIRTYKRAATSTEDSKRAKALTRFEDFLQGNKQLVLGNKAYANFDPTGETRFYDFSQQMRIRFTEGLDNGISVDALLNPRDPNYILKDDDYYAPSIEQQLQNIKEGFEQGDSTTLEDVKPPPRQPGQSADEYLNSEEYKLYVTSGKKALFDKMMLEAQN